MKIKTVKTVTEEHDVDVNVTADLPISVVKQLSSANQAKFKSLQKPVAKVATIGELPKTVRTKIVFLLSGNPRNVDELIIAYFRVFGEIIDRRRVYNTIHSLRRDGIVDRKEYRLTR